MIDKLESKDMNSMKRNYSKILMCLITVSCGENGGVAPGGDNSSGCTECKIFVSLSSDTGGTGLDGFDFLCNNDMNKPAGDSSYKALVASNTRNKDTSDWPLKKSARYYRPSGELITTTDSAGVFTLPLQNTFNATNIQVRTGLLPDMSVNNTCLNWTSNSAMETASYGETQFTDEKSYVTASDLCANPSRVYCVEQ